MFVASLMELTRIEIAYYALTNQEKGADFRKTIYIGNTILNLLVNDIFIGVILPCKVVYNMLEEIPESTRVIHPPIDSFYVRPMELTPRRDFEEKIDQPPQQVQSNRKYFSYLPQVDI